MAFGWGLVTPIKTEPWKNLENFSPVPYTLEKGGGEELELKNEQELKTLISVEFGDFSCWWTNPCTKRMIDTPQFHEGRCSCDKDPPIHHPLHPFIWWLNCILYSFFNKFINYQVFPWVLWAVQAHNQIQRGGSHRNLQLVAESYKMQVTWELTT